MTPDLLTHLTCDMAGHREGAVRTEADARRDPRPGDVLRRSRKCADCRRIFRRTVVDVLANAILGYDVVVFSTGAGIQVETLLVFRKWAASAEVVKVAQP